MELIKRNLIHEKELKQDYYFQSFFQLLCERNLLSSEEITRIQMGIIELLAKETDRFTNGESTSIPVEQAQRLLRSISYTIGLYLKSISDLETRIELLLTKSISELFYQGLELIQKQMDETREMLNWMQINSIKIDHIAYHDTIWEGLPEFFHDYNPEYSADEAAGMIDYQLFHDVEHLIGVEYIHEYLRRLMIENRFLMIYSSSDINNLMKVFHKDYEHMLINLFEVVLINAIGCEIAQRLQPGLLLEIAEQSWLIKRLSDLNEAHISTLLSDALLQLKTKLSLDESIFEYAKKGIPDLISRITNNRLHHSLTSLFLAKNGTQQPTVYYNDSTLLPDEELRDFIQELNQLPLISQKLERIREKIRSMEDWKEIIEECFYGEELAKVFGLLTEDEKNILYRMLKEEAGLEELSEYEPDHEWKKQFLNYYQHLNSYK